MSEVGDSNDAWLISGNPFDVIGAVSEVFDPWGVEPTLTVKNLSELCAQAL